jgi:hypothetical protein
MGDFVGDGVVMVVVVVEVVVHGGSSFLRWRISVRGRDPEGRHRRAGRMDRGGGCSSLLLKWRLRLGRHRLEEVKDQENGVWGWMELWRDGGTGLVSIGGRGCFG